MRFRSAPARWACGMVVLGMALACTAATHGAAASSKPAASPAPATQRAAPRARPNFSGTWKLDTTLSAFGKIPGGRPRARTDVIEHRDPALRQTLFLDNYTHLDTTVYRYTTDSTRAVNKVGGSDIEARVWWNRDTLRLESKTRLVIWDMWLKERWALSPDGKTLTMTRRVKHPMGEGDQRLVFARQ